MKAQCDKCEKEILVSEGFNAHYENSDSWLAENGLIVIVDGYYGGFIDDYDEPEMKLRLCHECSVDFWSQIPKLRGRKDKGLHPLKPNEDFCCDYSWTFNDKTSEILYADGSSRVISG